MRQQANAAAAAQQDEATAKAEAVNVKQLDPPGAVLYVD